MTFEPSFTVCSEEETEHDLYESGVWEPDLGYEWLWPFIPTDTEDVIVVREESPPTGEVAWGKGHEPMTLRAYSRGGSPRWTSNAGRERYDGFFLGKATSRRARLRSAPRSYSVLPTTWSRSDL